MERLWVLAVNMITAGLVPGLRAYHVRVVYIHSSSELHVASISAGRCFRDRAKIVLYRLYQGKVVHTQPYIINASLELN